MGKIFKALEKSEKQHFASSKDYAVEKSGSSEKDAAEPKDDMNLDTSLKSKRNVSSHNAISDELDNESDVGSHSADLSDRRSVDADTVTKLEAVPSMHKREISSSSAHKPASRKRVEVKYSKTKIQAVDPNTLKDNRVVSVFDDIETTNQFKMLRTQVLRKLKALKGNSILVTSANPCEGKTFTSINLGISIAKEFDRTVLIIDADIRRPLKQHTDFATEFFALNVEKGLTDYLEGEADIEDILINPGIDKLTLIPGGIPVDNSPELLNSARMKEMMAEIKDRYPADRLVILDGPSLLHFPDAMILYHYVDAVIPVIESERTSTEDVKKMMNLLKDVNMLGVVLNKNRNNKVLS